MQIQFEFAIYDDSLDTFTLDEKVYSFELNEEQSQSYELFKSTDLHLYNWFKESKLFDAWIKEEVYQDSLGKKIAICDINDISFRRFYFFKVTSGDVHYEYFKNLFGLIHELDWQDREDIGQQIIDHLLVKRQELIIELKEEEIDSDTKPEEDNKKIEVTE